jgi:deazaflavin-dependent oxidoreductase (nitroreductase family)
MLPRWMRRIVASASHSRLFGAIGPTVMPPLERAYRAVTRRPGPISELAVPSLVLHTTGARSGLARRAELICAPNASAGTLLVAGSSFARPRHPAWTYNLLAHPGAEVERGRHRTRVAATLLTDAEREQAWERLDDVLPGYRRYERAARREFRVFRLDLVE